MLLAITRQDPVTARVPQAWICGAFVVLWTVATTFSAKAQDNPQQTPANPTRRRLRPQLADHKTTSGPLSSQEKERTPPPSPPKNRKNMRTCPILDQGGRAARETWSSGPTKDGSPSRALKKETFKIIEDGAHSRFSNFSQTEAPITQ